MTRKFKIYPHVGGANLSHRNELGGAWRVYCVCRHLDTQGGGSIDRRVLRDEIEKLGAKDWNIRRWINAGLKAGVFHDRIAGKVGYYSLGKTAGFFGAVKVGRGVEINPALLFKNGWHKLVWAAIHAGKPKQISRASLEDQTGIPANRQWDLERNNPFMTVREGKAIIGSLKHLSVPEQHARAKELRDITGEGWRVEYGNLIKQRPNTYVTEMKRVAGRRDKFAQRILTAYLETIEKRVQAGRYTERITFKRKAAAEKAVLRALDQNPNQDVKKYWFLWGTDTCNYYGEVAHYA